MTISFSGLGSGLDTSSWVEALVSTKQPEITKLQTKITDTQAVKTAVNNTRSKVSTLRTAVEKFTDAKFGGTFDLFTKSTAKSSNEDVFTAVADSNAKRQNYDIYVKQLATYTKATSMQAVSSVADDDTSLKSLGITSGTLNTYVNGVKNTINIESGDTVGDLKIELANAGIKMDITDNGEIKFSALNEGDTIHVGATTDTSNFVSLVGLERDEDGNYVSSNSVYKATTSTKLTSEDAYWDDATGKLSITSKKEGASFINIEAGTSNFTDVMGLTESVWDEDGNVISSKMFTDAQELGQNAILSINGTNLVSTSNTVTSDVSRIQGVTITLKRTNTEEDGATSLDVAQDTSGLKDALQKFVDAYNDVIDQIGTVTANGAELHGESSLTSLKNTLRSYTNGANNTNGGVFKLLSEIGVSTTKAHSNNLSSDTNTLSFDESTFLKALEENPDSVKALLAGENGIFSMIEDTVEQSLKAASGFFDIKTTTLDSEIKKTEEKIKKKNASIEKYKAQLEKTFQSMENSMTKMQQNYQKFFNSTGTA